MRKCQPGQREIPDSNDHVEWIKQAEFGQTPTTSNRLRGLLYSLEFLTGNRGCFPSLELLALRMGACVRTVKRIVALARKLGILKTTPKIIAGVGKRENEYTVHWDKIRQLVPPSKICPSPPINVPTRGANGVPSRGARLAPLPREPERAVDGSPPTPIEDAEWLALEEEVRKRGVDTAESAVAAAVTAGCAVARIRQSIAEFDGRPHLTPAALAWHLQRLRPGTPAGGLWPKMSEEQQRQESVRKRLAASLKESEAASREYAKAKAQATADQRQLDALRAALEAMDDEDRESLILDSLDQDAYKRYRRSGLSPIVLTYIQLAMARKAVT